MEKQGKLLKRKKNDLNSLVNVICIIYFYVDACKLFNSSWFYKKNI